MKKTKIVTASLVVIISIMVLAGLATSLWGVELHSVEEDIAELENANNQIEEQIISKTSLTKLYEEHEQLGFAKPDRVIYVEGNASVAQAQ
jgi:cell division protein FtsL